MPNQNREKNGHAMEASITNPAQPVKYLRGSFSSNKELRSNALPLPPKGGNQFPPPPPPPPPLVSVPDMALEIGECLPEQTNSGIVSSVRAALGANADVRSQCIDGSQRIGVWLRPAVNDRDSQARERGLQRLAILKSGESFTFFVNAALIRRNAQAAWNTAPKRLNGDGNPDPDGPIHLTGFLVRFDNPNQVVTQIDGFDERPWPDVDFHLITTDTLTQSGGQLQCSSKRALDADTSWLNFLTGLFLIVLPPLGVFFLVEDIIISNVDAPDVNAGAGCGALSAIPQKILIPGGFEVVADYSRVEVSNGGIFAGGSFVVIPREPEVTISGITQVAVVEGTETLTRSFHAQTVDLRPNLKVNWSGEGFVMKPHAMTTAIRFNLNGAEVGQVLTRRIAVQVTDADNLSASDELIVRIHIIPKVGNLPPVCKVKPWLPQCRDAIVQAANERQPASQQTLQEMPETEQEMAS